MTMMMMIMTIKPDLIRFFVAKGPALAKKKTITYKNNKSMN